MTTANLNNLPQNLTFVLFFTIFTAVICNGKKPKILQRVGGYFNNVHMKKKNSTIRIIYHLLKLVFIFMMLVVGCGPASNPCGTFTFTGTGNSPIRGANIQVDFAFNPSSCSSTCTCNTICYIQCVRIIDINTGNFLSPNTDQTNRIVTGNATAAYNGWAIDRLSNRVWGYYGRNNDGTFAGTIITGSNSTTATLFDVPRGWPDNSWFDAITVPVCIASGSPCVDHLLGYYYWLFIVNPGPSVDDPFHEIGRLWHRDVVDLCITEWNNDAAALLKNAFPAMSRL